MSDHCPGCNDPYCPGANADEYSGPADIDSGSEQPTASEMAQHQRTKRGGA